MRGNDESATLDHRRGRQAGSEGDQLVLVLVEGKIALRVVGAGAAEQQVGDALALAVEDVVAALAEELVGAAAAAEAVVAVAAEHTAPSRFNSTSPSPLSPALSPRRGERE